tara:strand:+ start:200 stop:631 length:432 start_codon:yes stop_codon:yes gene_type:complete
MTAKRILVACAATLVLVAGGAFANTIHDAIAERLKPVGTVCMAGDPCAEEVGVVASAGGEGGARSGEAVYGQYCTACHGSGILQAPKTGDAAAWEARLAAAGSLDALTQSAIAGVGAMPPKGTCADCTDEEILASIQHMSGLE